MSVNSFTGPICFKNIEFSTAAAADCLDRDVRTALSAMLKMGFVWARCSRTLAELRPALVGHRRKSRNKVSGLISTRLPAPTSRAVRAVVATSGFGEGRGFLGEIKLASPLNEF